VRSIRIRRGGSIEPVDVRMRASGAAMAVSTNHAAFLLHRKAAALSGDLDGRQRASLVSALRRLRAADRAALTHLRT
jgi:hypothetical protein